MPLPPQLVQFDVLIDLIVEQLVREIQGTGAPANENAAERAEGQATEAEDTCA